MDVLSRLDRGSGGPRITKAATPVWCSRPLRCLRSRRLRSSSLARRQSPWARAVRLGRKRFFLASKAAMMRCDMARAVCPGLGVDATVSS